MLPWKSIIALQKDSMLPLYLQLSNAIIREIKSGVLKPGQKLPGTREMGSQLGLNRQTIVKAYEELESQEWIRSKTSMGTFVNEHLPAFHPREISDFPPPEMSRLKTGYPVAVNTKIKEASPPLRHVPGFHDGPDPRLVPVKQIVKAYRSVMTRRSGLHHLSYVDTQGKLDLRKVLSKQLNETRGMNTTPANILITRGSQMGVFLTVQVLLRPGDNVVVGNTNYYYTDRVFLQAGGRLLRVPVDEDGMDIDAVAQLCRRKKIRLVNVTSHHHYPTTVTLNAARRMQLLSLAERFGFAIIEDDYDYDFHYESSPILPLASADHHGMVVYVGTLSKTVAPALRIGYVAAPENLIGELTRLRQVIDIQGDPQMEQAVAEMYELGEIRRHMKKALKEYRMRRDHLCSLLRQEFAPEIQFRVPEGGLAIWALFDKKIPLPALSAEMQNKGFILSSGLIHDTDPARRLNGTRIGFGWMNPREAAQAIGVMREAMTGIRKGSR